jgi:hypothetical protein
MNTNPIKEARTAVAVAEGLRDAAAQCGPQQQALRARLIVAATCIDVLRELLLRAIAKPNQVERGELRMQ